MFESQGIKIMFDLHELSVKQVKKLLKENFAKMAEHNIGEFYLITGRGNHVNSGGSRGVLKRILPELLKPYCQEILQINPEAGAYKIILKPKQELNQLKDMLARLCVNENEGMTYAKSLQKAAKKNDIEALLALAVIHLHKAIKGFEDKNEGINLLLKAKQLGSLEADVQLGILYHEGFIVKQEHAKAFKYFLYAAQKNHPVAQYYVAVCYLHGKGVKYNDEQAVSWMKKAADQNDAYAQDALGDFYLLGKITQQNKPLGIEYKTKAAAQGLADAQIDLARCYATGYGVAQNYQVAFEYYLSAAQSNKPYAIYQVGTYLLEGRIGSPPNPAQAFNWFLKAAELGDADGQAQVAHLYLFGGSDIEQNISEGLKWVMKAVEQHNPHGHYVMARIHLELADAGIKQDGKTAYIFMKHAAEANLVPAQFELALYLLGKENSPIPKNFEEGLFWLEKAAEHNADAQKLLQALFKKPSCTNNNNAQFFKTALEPTASQEPRDQLNDEQTNANNNNSGTQPEQEISQQQSAEPEEEQQYSYASWCTVS